MMHLERQIEQLLRRVSELERELQTLRAKPSGGSRPYSEAALGFASDAYSGANCTTSTLYVVELDSNTPVVIDNDAGTNPLSVVAKKLPTGVKVILRLRDGKWIELGSGSEFDVRYDGTKFEKFKNGEWTTVFEVAECSD